MATTRLARFRPALLLGVVAGLSLLTACGSDSASSEPPAAAEAAEGEEKYPPFEDTVSGQELLTDLQGGGYVIFFRHGQTETDYADQADPSLNLEDCSTQRALSEQGLTQARTIGTAFTDDQIPVGEVYASDYCRAWKTAETAFGSYDKRSELNFAPAEEYTDEQVQSMKDNLTPFLTAAPPAGTNTVIVGHDDVFEAATGVYPEPQGVGFVVKPTGDGFELIAALEAQEWESLGS